MGKPVVVGCTLDVTITGSPTLPSYVFGSGQIVTLPSSSVKISGKPSYSGQLVVKIPLVFTPPVFVPIIPEGGVATLTINPSGVVTKVDGEPVVLEGDGSAELSWSGTDAATSSSPVSCSGTVSVKILDAGSSNVDVS